MPLAYHGASNIFEIGNNIKLSGMVIGNNNQVIIRDSENESDLHIQIHGDNNTIFIERPHHIKGLNISCGNQTKAHNTDLNISENFSIEPGGMFLLYTSGNKCHIGKNCMFNFKSTVLNALTIGNGIELGAMSCFTKDTVDPGKYVGTPARRIGDRIKFIKSE